MEKEAFYKLSYGLYVVSTEFEGHMNGYIANTAFQVTALPPKIAISCSKDNYTTAMIQKSGCFSISVLRQDASTQLLSNFGYNSGKNKAKFDSVRFIKGNSGAPIVVEDTLAWFDCNVVDQLDVGSHLLIIGEVLDNKLLDDNEEPLTYAYYRNVKKLLAPKNAPTYSGETSVIEKEKKVESHDQKEDKGPQYKCLVCGFVYDPEEGDPEGGVHAGTPFANLPEDWKCPLCSAEKDMFEEI